VHSLDGELRSALPDSDGRNQQPTDRIVAEYRSELIDRNFRERGDALGKAEASLSAFWRPKSLPILQDVRHIGKAP